MGNDYIGYGITKISVTDSAEEMNQMKEWVQTYSMSLNEEIKRVQSQIDAGLVNAQDRFRLIELDSLKSQILALPEPSDKKERLWKS